jgi:hypothetical protein
MPSHASSKIQYTEHYYSVVGVSRDGTRTTISHHDSFQAAERSRKLIPSADGVEIRIETGVESLPGSLAGL